jgi:hypothetical protein
MSTNNTNSLSNNKPYYDNHIFKHLCNAGIDINDLTLSNNNNLLHDITYNIAITNIPNMFIQSKMIIIDGSINNKPLKILLDTGASVSVIFLNTINRLGLSDLIDYRIKSELQGIGAETSIGKLWYTELKLEDLNFPITLTVVNNQIKEFDMILGINFLELYNASIDFENKKIKLNNKYDITLFYR